MEEEFRILYLDKNDQNAQLIRNAIFNEHTVYVLTEVYSRDKLETIVDSAYISLVITEINILGFNNLEIIQFLNHKLPNVPVLIFTANEQADFAIQSLKTGVDDYLLKKNSNVNLLRTAIYKAIGKSKQRLKSDSNVFVKAEFNDLLSSTFDMANIPLLLLSADGKIIKANDTVCTLFQMISEDMYSRDYNSLFDTDDPGFQLFLDVLGKDRNTESELIGIKKSGQRFPVQVSSKVYKVENEDLYTILIFKNLNKQKSVEECVQQERSLLRTLIDHLPHAIYVKDKEGRKLVANNADLKLMNCNTEEEILGKTDYEIFKNDDGKRGFDEDMTVIKTGIPLLNHENCFTDSNGKLHWRLISKIPLYDADKCVIGLVGFGYDITGRKMAENDLAWEQYLMHSLLDNIPDSIYFKDKESRFLRINKALAKRFQLDDPMKAIGLTDNDFFMQLHAQDALADEQRIIQTGEPIIDKEEIEIWIDKPSTWVSTTKMPLRNLNGEIIGTFGISRDITDRKRNEEQLMLAMRSAEEMELQYRSLFENMIEGFAYCKMIYEGNIPVDFIYLDVNHAFETLTGMKDAVGKRVNELVPGIRKTDYGLFEIYNRVAQSGKPERFETYIKSMNDWYSVSVYSPRKEYFIIVFDVITERKKVEEDLISARAKAEESDKLKTAFLHNITHEIRTPMNAIIGFSTCLKEQNVDKERRDYFIDIITKSANQLLSIINDIVNMATLEANQEKLIEKAIDVNLIIKMIYNQFIREADKKNISLAYSLPLPDGEVIINTDENKLMRVLGNLLNNALKFTKIGSVKFGYTMKTGFLEFFVQDTGIGISFQMHRKIFERFMQVENSLTREYGGSGLGLSIAKAYVEYLGGDIWLKSELGQGSTFFFTIPIRKEMLKDLEEKSKSKLESIEYADKVSILIAEDEEPNYLLLKEILSDLNCNILWAEDGKKAIEICKNHPVDLILMDLRMPLVNGFEATQQIKSFLPDVPIIAQTSYASDVDMQKALLMGCIDYITKPFSSELILSKISQYLTKK